MYPSAKFQDSALFLLRLIVAAIFLYAGIIKWGMWSAPLEGMSMVMWNTMRLLAIVEPLGGLALLVGFLTRWAAAGLAIIMVGAIAVMQFSLGVGFATPAGPGWSFPLSVLGGCLALMAFGAGRWSLDVFSKRL